MKRVLITGATGMIGQFLVPFLRQRGVAVVAAVRNASRLPPGVEIFATGDLGPNTPWQSAVAGVDAVVHLAAWSGERARARDEARIQRLNVAATVALAKAAADARVARFVFMSSVKAIGEVSGLGGFTEESPLFPRDAYGRSKRDAEVALEGLLRPTKTRLVILRPPLVYGPGAGANFRALLGLVATGVPLPLGSVRNRRSLIYVGNLADAVARVLGGCGASASVFLVSDGEDVSTPELVRRLARALDVAPRLFPCPPTVLRAGAKLLGRGGSAARLLTSLAIDDSRFRGAYSWSPPWTLDQGLATTADWVRNQSGGPPARRARQTDKTD